MYNFLFQLGIPSGKPRSLSPRSTRHNHRTPSLINHGLCFFMWLLRLHLCENFLEQSGHWCALMLLCMLTWPMKWSLLAKPFPHSVHTWAGLFRCTRSLCCLSPVRERNEASQNSHSRILDPAIDTFLWFLLTTAGSVGFTGFFESDGFKETETQE